MGYLKGEDVNLGVARETTRGTAETPTAWIPGRTPTGIRPVVEKINIRETKGSGVNSQGSSIVQKRSEGDLEFNVRNGSIGFFLLSLLGKVTTSANGAVYDHLFEVLTGNAQFPVLTLGLSQNGQQDYEYETVGVQSLELRTPVDDLVNATVSFVGVSEATHADYTPSFADDDYFFRHYDITIKIAANVAGLGAASPLKLKEFSLSIANNARVNQNISELNPSDVLAMVLEITGSMKLDYNGETHHDLYDANTSRAMQITLTRSDIAIDTGVNPEIVITMPNVTYNNWTPDRPIDDIVSEGIEFMAHFDDTEGEAINIVVTNEIANYN